MNKEASTSNRGQCVTCLRPPLACYCQNIAPFNPGLRFAILIHKRETQKRFATGRMSHLFLQNSELIIDYNDYSKNERVNEILADDKFFPVILYPGVRSLNLSESQSRFEIPAGKELVVFVIDGTWSTAQKTMLRSKNLQNLPRICFTPTKPSRFRIRQQPKEHFVSTIEAIHQTIDLIAPITGRPHDRMLEVFDHMVNQQMGLRQTRQRNHRIQAN